MENPSSAPMPLLAHLRELRRRLVYSLLGMLAVFPVYALFSREIYAFLVEPLVLVFAHPEQKRLIYTALPEAFMTYLKLGVFTSIMGAFPIISYQLWRFVAPALYKQEKQAFLPYLLLSPLLFLMGAALAFYGVMPLAFKFFVSFESLLDQSSLGLQLDARISQYLSLVLGIMLAFGFCFQLPILLTLLARAGLVTSAMLSMKRRYAIVLVLIVAAILTPPDVLSQLGLAIPLLLLYEISIVWIKRIERRKAASRAAQNIVISI
jgi:sec-independent protein translocase protein TatC